MGLPPRSAAAPLRRRHGSRYDRFAPPCSVTTQHSHGESATGRRGRTDRRRLGIERPSSDRLRPLETRVSRRGRCPRASPTSSRRRRRAAPSISLWARAASCPPPVRSSPPAYGGRHVRKRRRHGSPRPAPVPHRTKAASATTRTQRRTRRVRHTQPRLGVFPCLSSCSCNTSSPTPPPAATHHNGLVETWMFAGETNHDPFTH